jgi:predicted transcriptional regulator
MNERTYTSVRDTMTPEPRSIEGLATVSEAIEIMRTEGIRSLIIRKRHEGDEYGLIAIHDIAEKVIGQGRAPERVSVYEIMSKPAVTVDADMDVKYAIRLLTRFGLSRALVMEKDELVGIVTLRDMVFRLGSHGTRPAS